MNLWFYFAFKLLDSKQLAGQLIIIRESSLRGKQEGGFKCIVYSKSLKLTYFYKTEQAIPLSSENFDLFYKERSA